MRPIFFFHNPLPTLSFLFIGFMNRLRTDTIAETLESKKKFKMHLFLLFAREKHHHSNPIPPLFKALLQRLVKKSLNPPPPLLKKLFSLLLLLRRESGVSSDPPPPPRFFRRFPRWIRPAQQGGYEFNRYIFGGGTIKKEQKMGTYVVSCLRKSKA